MGRFSFDAVIFDLDGVVTKTALVHAAAWKAVFDEYLRLREKRDGEPFREFTHDKDYLPYVDGKPRYEGVKSFLESRGINLSFGETEDALDKETICGIGNRKNSKFLDILDAQGVEIYPSTVKFIERLKDKEVRIGVASSSKNCKYVLKSAGIEFLFESRVDGEVSSQMALKGKPEGDIFVTAALNLRAHPGKAVVVEDATSGVQAGRNGAFGLVLGIAREDNEDRLLHHGADVAIPDMEYIDPQWIEKWFQRKPRSLFDSWDKKDVSSSISGLKRENVALNPCYFKTGREAVFSRKKLVFFLDYDGTLTPIVERPELAVMSDEMRDTLKRVAEKHTVAIVSGRTRKDAEDIIGVDGIFYAGNHGFDIKGPGVSMVHPEAEKAVGLISDTARKLSEKLGTIPGVLIDEKGFSIAVHYRLVKDEYLKGIEETVNNIVEDSKKFRLMQGKKVFEILPAINWDKGKAVRWIMEVLGISWDDASVVYIGDDTTDEDAFRIIRTRGTGILVSEKPQVSAADFRVASTEDVKKLFVEALGGK